MAEATPPADPLAGLIDIPLPPPVSLWPQTWPSRIAVALVVATLIASAWRLVRGWRANRYRRAALAELAAIERSVAATPSTPITTLALLVRRTALAAFSRQEVAGLAGPAWLVFLDRSYRGNEFSQGPGQVLGGAAYQPHRGGADVQPLIDLIRRWIRRHHD